MSGGHRGRRGRRVEQVTLVSCAIILNARPFPVSLQNGYARVEHRCTERDTRCCLREHLHASEEQLERFGCGTCVPRWRCRWHRQGESNPELFRLYPGRIGGNRTLDLAVVGCLLYPTELHCVVIEARLARYAQRQSRSAPAWLWNHGR